MRTFTTNRLIDQVTLKAALANGDFSPQEILDLAYDALIAQLVPLLVTLREDFFVKNQDLLIEANKSHYSIPSRAAGSVLRDIKIIRGDEIVPIFRIGREEITTTRTGEPSSFYLEENSVVLYPTPSQSNHILRMAYFIRAPQLVPLSECGRINSIDTNTNTINGDFPSSWNTTNSYDLINSNSYENKAIDLEATSVSSSTISFSSALPTNLRVGDYVSLAEQSCFIQIPADAQQILVDMTVVNSLEAKGDRDGIAIAQQKVDRQIQILRTMLQERVEGRPQRFRTRLI
jgi:hypothetical protein